MKEQLIKDEDNHFGYHLRDEDFYIYLLAESYKQWDDGSAGFRTILDVYLYRRAKPYMDETYTAGEFHKLELTEFKIVLLLGGKLFGPVSD